MDLRMKTICIKLKYRKKYVISIFGVDRDEIRKIVSAKAVSFYR